MTTIILIEGKKEEVSKKLKQRFEYDHSFIDNVLEKDPTGYKYVEYIAKQIERIIPQLTSSVGGLNVMQTEGLLDYFGNIIPWFHLNSDKITYDDIWKADTLFRDRTGDVITNIDRIADTPKDINVYENPDFFKDLIKVVDARKSEREKEREAKSQVEKIFEDDDVLVVRPKTHVASCYYGANTKWCTTTKDSPSYFDRYVKRGRLFYFINKKSGLKMALLSNLKEKVLEVYDSRDKEVTLVDLIENFPNQEEIINELTGSTQIVKNLRKFAKGKLSPQDLESSDPLISAIKLNEPLGLSEIIMDFGNDEKFLKLLDLSEDDIWFLNMINSNYSNYEFIDSYTAEQDFKDGYTIYYDLDEENLEKLKKIAKYILPNKEFDLEDDAYKTELSNTLIDLFEREMDWIIGDYASEKNNEMTTTARDSILKEITEEIERLGFRFKRDFDLVTTTPANLVSWVARFNINNSDLFTLVKNIISGNVRQIGGWYENSYEFRDDKNFDSESFNRTVSRYFDDIIEKIEDENGEEKLRQYLDLYKKITSKFRIGRLYELPKDPEIGFRINGFDKENLKIILRLEKTNPRRMKDISLSEENFYKLLHQRELFNIFDNSK